MVDTTGQSDVDYYYAHDHLYSTVALTDSAGDVVERYEYDAYGNVHIMDGNYNSRSSTLYDNPYTFTGRRLDSLDSGNLNIMYYRHRSYHPQLGRFLQHDPLGINPDGGIRNPFYAHLQYINGINSYQYVMSQPPNAYDPEGLAVWWDCVVCGLAFGAKFGGQWGGAMYFCPRDNPNISWGECVSQVLDEAWSKCELWEDFKKNPGEWAGAAVCISCGVTIIKEIAGPAPPPDCDDDGPCPDDDWDYDPDPPEMPKVPGDDENIPFPREIPKRKAA